MSDRQKVPSLVRVSVVALALSALGCPATEGVVLDDKTIILPEELYDTITVEAGRLVFDPALDDATFNSFDIGSILVGGTDGGFLRRVESKSQEGGQTLVDTSQASITDAVKQGDLSHEVIWSEQVARDARDAGGFVIEHDASGTVLHDDGALTVTLEEGLVSLHPDAPNLSILINSPSDLQSVGIVLAGTQSLNLGLHVEMGNGPPVSDEVTIPLYTNTSQYDLGGWPVWDTVSVDLIVGFEASGSAGVLDLGADISGAVTHGFQCNYEGNAQDCETIKTEAIGFAPVGPTTNHQGAVSFTAYARLEWRFELYSVPAMSMDTRSAVELDYAFDAQSDPPQSWSVYGNFAGHTSIQTEIFDNTLIIWTDDLFDVHNLLSSFPDDENCADGIDNDGDGLVDCDDDDCDDNPACQGPEGWVLVTAGTHTLGSPAGETCRIEVFEAQRQVTLTREFYVATKETTQSQFEDLMGYNPTGFVNCGADCPADSVTWHEALAYASALSVQEGLPPCYNCTGSEINTSCSLDPLYSTPYECTGYRLPTESEWEVAARAGEAGAHHNGGAVTSPDDCTANYDIVLSNGQTLGSIAWYSETSGFETHPVAQLLPNNWGMFDVAGNVLEWTLDQFWDGGQDQLWPAASGTDPLGQGPGYESRRVCRGGGINISAGGNRSAARNATNPLNRQDNTCFRLVRTAP